MPVPPQRLRQPAHETGLPPGAPGLDAAKLGCCRLGSSPECRGLCGRAFSREWGRAWDALHSACLARPQEAALAACLAEADAPCQQGCAGMAFCATFNNRPNALFRSCTPRADDAARKDFQLWQDSLTLTLPGLTAAVPLRGVRAGASGGESAAAAAPCAAPSARPGSPCVTLAPFLAPSAAAARAAVRVPTFPCRPHPCPPRHVCSVNPNHLTPTPRPRMRIPAAHRQSPALILRLPSLPALSSPESARCGRVCECAREGVLQGCRYLPCVDPAPCLARRAKYGAHSPVSRPLCHTASIYTRPPLHTHTSLDTHTLLPHTPSPSRYTRHPHSHTHTLPHPSPHPHTQPPPPPSPLHTHPLPPQRTPHTHTLSFTPLPPAARQPRRISAFRGQTVTDTGPLFTTIKQPPPTG
ncbi:mRECK [Penaeus vannamei]|uniref:MRECK n=1 Tax=Penaeus vannamei TaxID=6689 RepID=A0A423TW12_PENVA|nr:mRECK [Penaeus vannamei]